MSDTQQAPQAHELFEGRTPNFVGVDLKLLQTRHSDGKAPGGVLDEAELVAGAVWPGMQRVDDVDLVPLHPEAPGQRPHVAAVVSDTAAAEGL